MVDTNRSLVVCIKAEVVAEDQDMEISLGMDLVNHTMAAAVTQLDVEDHRHQEEEPIVPIEEV